MDIVTDSLIDKSLEGGWKRISHYENSHTSMDFMCPAGHVVSMRWYHYKGGTRCVYCSGLAKLTNQDIDRRLEEGWKRLSNYVNSQTPLELVCPNGHTVKIKWANYQQGKRCAYCFKETNKGSTHHSWKSWLTDAIRERRARKNLSYKEWRIGVYSRDNYQCQICGKKSRNLHAHHLMGFHQNVDLRYDISNGVTVCEKCHIEFHRRYGKENNTPQQFYEYKKNLRYG